MNFQMTKMYGSNGRHTRTYSSCVDSISLDTTCIPSKFMNLLVENVWKEWHILWYKNIETVVTKNFHD